MASVKRVVTEKPSVKQVLLKKSAVKDIPQTAVNALLIGTPYDSEYMYDDEIPYNDANGGANSTDKAQLRGIRRD